MSTWGVEEEVKRWIDFGVVDLLSVAATLLHAPLLYENLKFLCISFMYVYL